MWPLPRFSKPRDDSSSTSVIPAACFESCNNANLEAQSKGKVQSLCSDVSAFTGYVQECNSCLASNGGNTTATIDSLQQYINFCKATNPQYPSADASWLETYTTSTSTTVVINSIDGKIYSLTEFQFGFGSSTRPEYFFHLSVGSIVSSYIPAPVFSQLASSVSLSAGAAGVPGDATSLIYWALEATSVPSWFSAAVPATYSSQIHTLQQQINQLRATPISLAPVPTSSTTSSSTPSAEDSGAQRSKAWIAGPVVGGTVAIFLFALGVFIYQRRRRRRAAARPELEGDTFQQTGDKPQLHSDHLPPRYLYEMDASQAPSEADDGALPEMAANEAPARELAADHHHSQTPDGGEDAAHPVAFAEEREKHQNVQGAVEARPS